MGIVVSVDLRDKKQTYHLDDGTAIIRCVNYVKSSNIRTNGSLIKLGDVTSIIGRLAISESIDDPYEFMILIDSAEVVDDPNFECYHWISCMHQHQHLFKR